MKRSPETEREVAIGKLFSQYENFVDVLDCQHLEETIELTMPLLPGTLLSLVTSRRESGGLTTHSIRRIFRQVVAGVHTMHSLGYVHKDLKLENMLVNDEGSVMLCDFGFSTKYQRGKATLCDNLGSLHYAAPELWLRQAYEGPEVDVWALGVCLFILATGCFPFGGKTAAEIYHNIETLTALELPFPRRGLESPALKDLIRKMLTFDRTKRITLMEVSTHPFLCKPLEMPLVIKDDSVLCSPRKVAVPPLVAPPAPSCPAPPSMEGRKRAGTDPHIDVPRFTASRNLPSPTEEKPQPLPPMKNNKSVLSKIRKSFIKRKD